MLSTGKLLSNRGEHSYYHLNVSQQFEAWLQRSQFNLVAAFLAYGGSRFFWFMENAARLLVNADLLMTFLHTLLVCVKEPNKLVQSVFDFLSCKYTLAALASRSIMFIEFVSVARFVTNRLLGRRDVHKFTTIAIVCLRSHLPRGMFLDKVKAMKDDPG